MRLPSSTLGYRRLFHHLAISATVLSNQSAFAFSTRMSTHATERSDGTVTISPRNEASQSGLVVICHGLGDSAEGFADVAEVSLLTFIGTWQRKKQSHFSLTLLLHVVYTTTTFINSCHA
jgi:predicted esterase